MRTDIYAKEVTWTLTHDHTIPPHDHDTPPHNHTHHDTNTISPQDMLRMLSDTIEFSESHSSKSELRRQRQPHEYLETGMTEF